MEIEITEGMEYLIRQLCEKHVKDIEECIYDERFASEYPNLTKRGLRERDEMNRIINQLNNE